MRTTIMQNKFRQSHLDVIAGILILFMVFHHACPDNALHRLLSRVFFFFMPWFFFKAGMFFRQKEIKEVILSSVRRLLVPYLIFVVVGQTVFAMQLYMQHNLHINFITNSIKEILLEGSPAGNGSLWFLWTLFLVRLIYAITSQVKINVQYVTFLFGLLAYGFNVLSDDNLHPLYLANTCLGVFYYGLGYLLKDRQYTKILAFPCIVIYLLTIFVFPILGSFVNNSSDNYLWYNLAALAACIAYNYIFSLRQWSKGILQFCGRNSLEILVCHIPIINIIRLFYI